MKLIPLYGPQFKEQIVKKMMPHQNQRGAQISRDTVVAVPTFYSWEKLFSNQGLFVPAKSSRPDDWNSKGQGDPKRPLCRYCKKNQGHLGQQRGRRILLEMKQMASN